MKQVFTKLKETKVVSAEAMVEWKEDVNSKAQPGKQQALIQVMAMITELEAQLHKEEPEDEDEDEDFDDGDDDDYGRRKAK
jgi:hypothetical protein